MSDAHSNDAERELDRWLRDEPDAAAVPPWTLDDERRPGVRWRRTTIVLAAVVAPWTLLAAFVLLGGDGGAAATGATPARGSAMPSELAQLDTAADDAPRLGAPSEPHDPPPDALDAPSRPPAAVIPTAIRLLRDAVTDGAGPTTSALDAAAAEPPSALSTDMWIVRVHAVVLRGNERRWTSATHEIWAVPVGRRANAIVGLDNPWRVADPAHEPRLDGWQPTQVDVDAVRAALGEHGIDGNDVDVQQHPDLPWLLRATTADGPVWLQFDDELTVLGASTSTTGPSRQPYDGGEQ